MHNFFKYKKNIQNKFKTLLKIVLYTKLSKYLFNNIYIPFFSLIFINKVINKKKKRYFNNFTFILALINI